MFRAIFEKLIVIPILTITICNILAHVYCLGPRLSPGDGPLGLVDWLLVGVALVLVLIMAAAIAIDHLLKVRSVVKRVTPWMYRLAMRCQARSHSRLWLENKIMKAGREVLNIKRVRSAKRVIEALAKAAVRHVETIDQPLCTGSQSTPDFTTPLEVYEGGRVRKVERPAAAGESLQRRRPRCFSRPRSAFQAAA